MLERDGRQSAGPVFTNVPWRSIVITRVSGSSDRSRCGSLGRDDRRRGLDCAGESALRASGETVVRVDLPVGCRCDGDLRHCAESLRVASTVGGGWGGPACGNVTRGDGSRQIRGPQFGSQAYSSGDGRPQGGRSDRCRSGRCSTGRFSPADDRGRGSRLWARPVHPRSAGLVGVRRFRGRGGQTCGVAALGQLPLTAECGQARRDTERSPGKDPHLGRRLAGHLGVGSLAARSASSSAAEGSGTAVDGVACALRRSRCAPRSALRLRAQPRCSPDG
jgi:hypothetical protein